MRYTWTLSPTITLQSVFSLLPPIAVFIGTLMLQPSQRIKVINLLVIFSFFSIIIGFMQIAGGADSPLRPYTISNKFNSVGFFANRNHLAALLYCAMPFVAILFFTQQSNNAPRRGKRGKPSSANNLKLTGIAALIILLVLGVAITSSRAGLLLMMVAIVLSLGNMIASGKSSAHGLHSSKLSYFLLLVLSASLVAAYYSFDILFARFGADNVLESRSQIRATTWQAIVTYFPFGSGTGTFEMTYKLFEKPDTVLPVIINRAHNDYYEWLLEAGIFAAVVMALAFIWLATRFFTAWFQNEANFAEHEKITARAASISIVLVLAHSWVDYPLRTGALSALFAFFCALMVPTLLRAPATRIDSVTGSHGIARPEI